jgi:hypothetical protein
MTQVLEKHLRHLASVVLLVTAVSGNAQSAGLDNRIAPKASTPQQYADYYVLYVLTPSMREKLDNTSADDRPELAKKFNVWVGQVYDAIMDFENKSALTKEDAIAYLKSNNFNEGLIDVFNKSMTASSARNQEQLEQDIANAVLDAIAARNHNDHRGNFENVLSSIEAAAHSTEIGRLNELFGREQDPLKFRHFPYLTVRWDFQLGRFAYASSKYTADLDPSTTEKPAPMPHLRIDDYSSSSPSSHVSDDREAYWKLQDRLQRIDEWRRDSYERNVERSMRSMQPR